MVGGAVTQLIDGKRYRAIKIHPRGGECGTLRAGKNPGFWWMEWDRDGRPGALESYWQDVLEPIEEGHLQGEDS